MTYILYKGNPRLGEAEKIQTYNTWGKALVDMLRLRVKEKTDEFYIRDGE